MGIGPIPRSKIREYAREYGFPDDTDAADRFCRLISEMDNTYLQVVNESSSGKLKKNEPHQIPVDDVVGLKNMFANLARRQKNAKRIEAKPVKAIEDGRRERRPNTDD
jgi:hypothetical protein